MFTHSMNANTFVTGNAVIKHTHEYFLLRPAGKAKKKIPQREFFGDESVSDDSDRARNSCFPAVTESGQPDWTSVDFLPDSGKTK